MSQAGTVDVEQANPNIPTRFDADTSDAIPIANVLNIVGSTVANATNAKPLSTDGSGNTITIEVQVGAAITGAPADKNDAGLVSFDDTIFSVTEHGYVSLLGGGLAIDSLLTDVAGPTQPTGAGEVSVTGTSIFSDGTVANTLTLNVQATANTFLLGAGTDTNATELGPLLNGEIIIGSTGLAPVAGTLSVLTVANATNATPLFVDVGAGTLNLDLQVATERTGAPANMNDAGICSFDDTEFVVDANGFVSLVGLAGAPAIQKLDGDGGGVVGPDAAGKVTIRGLTVANATRSKPLWIEDNPGANSVAHEIQVSAAITGAPVDNNDAGIASFDDTEFTVDANGFVQLAGTGAGQTITGDSGGALSPTAGNWNILGLGETSTSGTGSTLSILSPRVAEFIVDPTLNNGTHQTITAALAAASSGDTIYIRPGTYTENLTVQAGVNLYSGSGQAGFTILTGKIDISAGTSTFRNLIFRTNADVIVSDTGSVLNQSIFTDCVFFLDDGDCIELNNSNSNPQFINCAFRQSGSNFDLYNITSCGIITFERSVLTKTGATTGTATISTGGVTIRYCDFDAHTFTTSSTANMAAFYSSFSPSNENLTPITTAGTGTNTFIGCIFESGTAQSVVAGSGTTINLINCTVNSTNTTPIAGAGTVVYSDISMRGTGNNISPTTATTRYTQLGKFRALGQPCFQAIPSATLSNVTGNGTVYTVVFATERFDQNSNFSSTTFTAPVTGKYQFNVSINLAGITASGTFLNLTLVTSNYSYRLAKLGSIGDNIDGGQLIVAGSIIADMDVSDTATVTIQTGGEGADVVDITTGTTTGTFFSGELIS